MSRVLIIGGGAAGMMAAVAAAGNGHETELFEKNEKLGKKLFITGNKCGGYRRVFPGRHIQSEISLQCILQFYK